ncbi:MAG: TPM domain-containing protein [Bacteroidota bacterium]
MALQTEVAHAQVETPALTGRVVDLAEMLDEATQAQLVATLAMLEDSTTHQVAVLTLPNLAGEAIEPVATRIFNAWGLGQQGFNNGVLLLIARDDRRLRIEVGVGLEGVLTDSEAGRIIRNTIVPRFRQGDFPGGIRAGVLAIERSILGQEAQAGPQAAVGRAPLVFERPKTAWGRAWWFLAYDTGWLGLLLLPLGVLALYGLAFWLLVASLAQGARWFVLFWVAVLSTLVVFAVVIFLGELTTIMLYDRSLRGGNWLWSFPLVWLAGLGYVEWRLERDPVWQRWRQAMRRVARLKADARKHRRKVTIHTWGKTVEYDGKQAASSGGGSSGGGFSGSGFSGGGFSGGGGFSSGGGASGGW